MKKPVRFLKKYSDFPRKVSVRSFLRNCIIKGIAPTKGWARKPAIRLFYCHYVFDDQVEEFERKVLFLQSHGRFVTDDEVAEIVTLKKEISENVFHLSFDDGFRNIIQNALPILARHRIPSTFFVPTAIIGADYSTVKDYCLNATKYPGVIEMASWDDLKIASASGMSIASHTRTHKRFAEMSTDLSELQDEIMGSKEELERKLGQPCRHISWPYGSIHDADKKSLEFVRIAGYAGCFGAFRGSVKPTETSQFYLPRHHFEPQWPFSHFTYFAKGGYESH